MIDAKDIKLYPMTADVTGRRTHQEYVDEMASMLVGIVIGYRLDYGTFRKLLDYAEENHERLNK